MSALYGDSVLYHTANGVAWITLNRPSTRNRLDLPMATALGRACRLVMQDDEVRAVVVTGTADVFCEGDDSDGPAAAGAEERQAYLEARRAAAFIGAVEKPVAALLNGDAIDHGLELALACDFRLAAAGARFGMTQVTRGAMPYDGGTQRLPRAVGRAWAADLLLTGRLIDAQEALEIGLVHEVHPADLLAERGVQLACSLAALAPIAARYAKESVLKGMDMTLEQGMRLEMDMNLILQTTADRAEGIASFLERREPEYRGE